MSDRVSDLDLNTDAPCYKLQQGEVLRKHLDLRIKYYYGEMNVDCWNKAEWLKEWNNHDVMLMTPQILLDILRHGFITVSTGLSSYVPCSSFAEHHFFATCLLSQHVPEGLASLPFCAQYGDGQYADGAHNVLI